MNNGLIIERNFKSVYNGKLFENLNYFQKKFILELFPNISKKDFIICKKYNKEFAKPDITISCNKLEKFISIKSGSSDGMHIEDIKSFILFLRNLGVSTETQKILLLYHYGDGTLDGTGKKRMLHNEIVFKYRNLIEFANKELADTRIVLECLKRFVLQGTSEFMRQIDYIYYGDENYGVYCSKCDLANFIISRDYSHLKTLHIGPMTIQPYLRDVDNKSKNIYKRHKVQIKWHYLLTDIEKVNSMKRITNYKLRSNKYFNFFKD